MFLLETFIIGIQLCPGSIDCVHLIWNLIENLIKRFKCWIISTTKLRETLKTLADG
jgi:hypothetical protein